MLYSIEQVKEMITAGKSLSLAADEEILKTLPKGKWIGGSIPYFMDKNGGEFSEEKIFVTEIPALATNTNIKMYDTSTIKNVSKDAYDNGYSIIIIPGLSDIHVEYAKNAPSFEDIFLKPIIGWISGINLANLGKVTPKIINGETGEINDKKAVVINIELPAGKTANIGIVNIFEQGQGDEITFTTNGFSVVDCFVNGEKTNFADYLTNNKIDTKLPLVANYSGAMVNVSFQAIDEATKTVNLYAPVFDNMTYKIASPIADYETSFASKLKELSINPTFSCNCILNYLYGELEGKQTGNIVGPITFGEIAYQLLNQTLVYVEIM